MQILPIQTPLLRPGDDLAAILADGAVLEPGDIVAVSSKAVATVEGAAIDLSKLTVTKEAEEWARKLRQTESDPAFRQAVLNETARMNGQVVGTCPFAMLTELKPDGVTEGTILAVNAGLDRSNVAAGFTIGWPVDPVASARELRAKLEASAGGDIGVLITDSCCRPRRLGVTAMALTVSGFPPLVSQVGHGDLFGHNLRMTHEAVADQLACAANFLMGNTDQSMPAAIIRGHGLALTDDSGWVPGIDPAEDLFQGMFQDITL